MTPQNCEICSINITIYIKEKKVQTEDLKKKYVTTVATVEFEIEKKKCITQALLTLQCLHSINTLSTQYRSTVAALLLFIYKIYRFNSQNNKCGLNNFGG